MYGLFLAIWGSVFIEFWKSKQDKLIFEWDLKSLETDLQNEERKEKFQFMNEYNSETNTRVKTETGENIRKRWQCLNYFVNLILIALVIFGMALFDYLTYNNVLSSISDLDPPQIISTFLDWQTAAYSVYIELLGLIFEWSVVFFMNKRNYRFKQDYNNDVQNQLFTVNCINFYSPIIYIAFRKRNYQALFTMMLIVIVLEQTRAAIMKWIKPLCCYRRGINKVKQEWADKHLQDTENPGQRNMIE